LRLGDKQRLAPNADIDDRRTGGALSFVEKYGQAMHDVVKDHRSGFGQQSYDEVLDFGARI
jgi:hypothetical protein